MRRLIRLNFHTPTKRWLSRNVRPPRRGPPAPAPPPPPPDFLSSSKTLLGKVSASTRHVLNRFQPWTADHRLAVASWLTIGTTWWFIAGTSTFLSLALWVLPSDRFQAMVARKVSEHVAQASGCQVTFGSAIQPSWKSLRLQDVHVFRNEETSGVKGAMGIDLRIESVDVNVSVLWALEGKGLVKGASVQGMRGTIDRREAWTMYHEDGSAYSREELEAAWSEEPERREWYKGSPELHHFSMRDTLVTLYQPEPERPLQIAIFNMESHMLRRQWLFYDLLASEMEGAFDNRLFSLRPPVDGDAPDGSRRTRLRMDGLAVDVIQAGITGPLAWLTEGRLDVDALLNFPLDTQQPDAAVRIDMDMSLNHLTAHVPMNSPHMSYLSSALTQPIVVFMNTNYVNIPLSAAVRIPIAKFDGSWTPYEACVTAALSEAVGVELSRLVRQQKEPANLGRLLWYGLEGIGRALRRGSYLLWHHAV